MITILSSKEVRIRKQRQCWGCGFASDVGRIMKYVVHVDNGDFGSCYWCEVCDEYLQIYGDDYDDEDGIQQNEFKHESHYHDFRKDYLCKTRKVLTEKFLITTTQHNGSRTK